MMLPRAVRAELRGLPKELADIVGAHLVAAGELIDEEPELALAHAHAARRRAARLPIVREATAETAYAAGDWQTALTEYRALYRMGGSQDFVPVMADCERALGRPREALKLLRAVDHTTLDPAMALEATIVEAGARADLGQADEALRVLSGAVASHRGPRGAQARLHYAIADLLEQHGRTGDAVREFERAAELDDEEVLDAGARLARLGAGDMAEQGIDIIAMVDDDEPQDDAREVDAPAEEDEAGAVESTDEPSGAVEDTKGPRA